MSRPAGGPGLASRASRRLAVSAVVLLGVVAGCGLAGSPTPRPTVAISLLEWQPKRAQVMEGLLPAFEAAMASQGRPVEVSLESLDLADDAFRSEIAERYAAGTAPDVTSYPTNWIPDFGEQGYLADMSPRLADWSDWEAHFYDVLRDRAVSPDGRIYAVPRGATVIQLFYRKDVLEANGIAIEQPASWQELVDRMVTLRDRMDRPPILIPAGQSWGGGTFDEGFINLMLGTGSPLYDTATDRWVVRSQGLTDVFGMYETLVRDRLLPVAPLLEPQPWEPTKYQTFPDGDLAVTTQGSWGWRFDWGPEGRRPIDDLDERVATWRFPTVSGEAPFVWAAEAWGWTTTAASRHQDEAWELIRWLSSGQALAADLVAVGNLSPRDDISDLAPYKDEPHLIADERLMAGGRSFTPHVGIEAAQDAVGAVTEGILTGRLGAAAAGDEFDMLMRASLGADRVTVEGS